MNNLLKRSANERPHRPPSTRVAICLLVAVFSAAGPRAQQPTKPEPEPALSVANSSLQRAVKLTLAALKPHQKSLVRGTAKDSLFLLMPEWGADIQELLALSPGNVGLAAELCARACSVNEATLLVMQAAHEVLVRSNQPCRSAKLPNMGILDAKNRDFDAIVITAVL